MRKNRKYDLDVEADAIIEWALKDDAINLNGFCIERNISAECVSRFCKKSEEFELAFGIALCHLAVRRERLVSEGKLYPGTWMRNARVYDRFLRHGERDEKEFDSNLKKSEKECEQINLSDLITKLTNGTIKQPD